MTWNESGLALSCYLVFKDTHYCYSVASSLVSSVCHLLSRVPCNVSKIVLNVTDKDRCECSTWRALLGVCCLFKQQDYACVMPPAYSCKWKDFICKVSITPILNAQQCPSIDYFDSAIIRACLMPWIF